MLLVESNLNLRLSAMLFALAAPATMAFGQSIPDSPPDALQVRYAANLNLGDSFINITNTGTQSTATGAITNICVNVYAFTADESMFACCSCIVTPDALVSLSVQRDMLPRTLFLFTPTALVVKLVASTGTCNAAHVNPANLATGMAAWGTTIHRLTADGTKVGSTETPFVPRGLSAPDLAHLTGYCGFIQAVGSGFGLCRSCPQGGLGATKQ
jgi:hypothetical protein